jgi:hypothetical protein
MSGASCSSHVSLTVGSAKAVLWSGRVRCAATHRRLNARHPKAIEANAEVDRQSQKARRDREEAGRRQRANVYYSGIQVSVPGEGPPDWANMPSRGEDE